ncbi:MAG: SDR family oxidoreductase [Verrucomicrobia bacterium]|nr:SDR family oxidoreductase [Verrucomicrobiota bacterium]
MSTESPSRTPLAWITGAGGLIGSHLVREASRAVSWRAAGLTRQQLDLTNFNKVREAFHKQRPALVIHCAAMSRPADCQVYPARAQMINVNATACLAELAAEIPFVFFSTDHVFDGREGRYNEESPVNPLTIYAETKVAAERIVLANPRHLVVRTSLNGGVSPTEDRGFNEALRRAWVGCEVPKLFVDEFRSPIAARVTAHAVWELIAREVTGIVHVAGAERLSRWQIGQLLAARWPQLNPHIETGSVKNYPGGPRPADTSLDSSKAQKLLSFHLPGLTGWLAENPNETF